MYSKTSDTTYLVYWPDHRIAKAGYSECQRWRSFELRGAMVIGLVEWPRPYGFRGAFALETAVENKLRERFPSAFKCKEEAEPYLGNRGGGYLECYRIPQTFNEPEQYLEELLVSTACVLDTSMSTNVRTYLRRTTHLDLSSYVGNARRGVARFDRQIGSADAARGLCTHQEEAHA